MSDDDNHETKREPRQIEFDKNIPIPPLKSKYKYSFDHMQVGDSFVGGLNEGNARHIWRKRNGCQFTRRRLEGQDGKWGFWKIA